MAFSAMRRISGEMLPAVSMTLGDSVFAIGASAFLKGNLGRTNKQARANAPACPNLDRSAARLRALARAAVRACAIRLRVATEARLVDQLLGALQRFIQPLVALLAQLRQDVVAAL